MALLRAALLRGLVRRGSSTGAAADSCCGPPMHSMRRVRRPAQLS
jgi:hypothetical protein